MNGIAASNQHTVLTILRLTAKKQREENEAKSAGSGAFPQSRQFQLVYSQIIAPCLRQQVGGDEFMQPELPIYTFMTIHSNLNNQNL